MNNETDVSIRFKNSITGEKKLEKYAETLKIIQGVLNGINIQKTKEVDSVATKTKDISKYSEKAAKNFNLAFNYTMLRTFSRILSNSVRTMSKMVTKSSEYAENINLYQVAFDGATEKADKFVNKLTEMYGLDESWLTKTVGIFKQLSNAMGLSIEQGTKLATLLTQMSVDVSSLYNIDVDKASSVLQSALAGQTKPIRGATGGDITVPTLQTTLDSMGIQRYVSDLSYAEKRLLIIISLTQQLNKATNDFGKTIESPANQMRILNEQWERLSRAIGNVFMPLISRVLPILNGVIMALVEIINLIASLFGYDIKDYDYGVASVADSFLDLEDNIDGAAESAKKLRSGLRGFDKLNVISSPSDSGKGGAGGIDPAIMDAFNKSFDDYNSKLKDVEMRATKIRDSIMEWLGFTKIIDEETGKVSFKFEHITSGTVLGALAVGGTIYSGIYLISTILAKMGIISEGLPSLLSIISGILEAIAAALGISVGWVVAIGVALGVAIALLVTYWDEISKFFTDIATWFYEKVIAPVGKFFKDIFDWLKPVIDAIWSIFKAIFDNIADIVVGVGKAIWEIIKKVGEIFAKIVEIFIALGKSFYTYIIQPIFDFLKPIVSWVYNNIIQPILDKINWFVGKAIGLFKSIGTTVVDFIGGAIKAVINGVFSGIEGSINFFIKMLNGAIGLINKIPGVDISKVSELRLPRLKVGMDFVPNDYYPAYLDYGERVLTKEENRDYTAHLQGLDSESKPTSLNPTFVIQVGDEIIAKKVIKDLEDMATTNGSPIVIGG